ncbi:hypothetical protein [Actinomadura parmotrematis]|uniref:VTT domain-containing protein n=1 Tax=Actinomadura parmotrematis TaxID=2864039 RepID=A0ABS7FP54_9ACTN|nr:hypothetical protein [Actinomadura parmotrematis]MBW8482178.1 hypothetical protein [Actinomadura parmotrematis]
MLFSPGWRGSVRQDELLAVFTLGLLFGGTLSATVLWLLSGLAEPLPSGARAWLVVAVAVLGALREFGLVRLPLPQNARQIPQEVLQTRLRRGTLQFGFELGTGVRTYVSASTPYVLALGLLLSHQGPLPSLLAGLAFGAGRALSAALTLWSRDPDRDAAIAARLPWITRLTALTLPTALALLALHPLP